MMYAEQNSEYFVRWDYCVFQHLTALQKSRWIYMSSKLASKLTVTFRDLEILFSMTFLICFL
jgi:hypothetical protein